jgi:hypothetical protein
MPTIPLALRIAFVSLVGLILSVGLMGVTAAPPSRLAQRIANEHLWESRPATNYRMVVQVMMSGRNCLQEIEVRAAEHVLLHDTCGTMWLASMSIDRMFELSKRLENAPECFPSSANCICRRVRVGKVTYDPQLGYPGELIWRRELRPNFEHPDFWLRVWDTQAIPRCTSASRSLSLTVLSMTLLK